MLTLSSRPTLFPTGHTILKVIVVARWLTWSWMAAILVFTAGADLRHPVVAWLTVAASLAFTVVSTRLLRHDPEQLLQAPFVAADIGFAIGLSIIDGFVFVPGHVFATTQSLATQWPLIAMATVGVAYGPVVAAVAGASIGPAECIGALQNGFRGWGNAEVVSIVATSIFFAACGAVFGWLAQLLRTAEDEIADRRARDEVGRVLHDTVLQTLALVERRSGDHDPDLAAAARAADRDLRAFLFGSAARVAGDLDSRIRAEVERVRLHHDVPVSVSVIDDGCRLNDREQDLFARAIGESVANALEHAAPTRVVVFVDTDASGDAFASINDDGVGFDPALPRTSHGIDESIIGRVESIGGRVEVVSTPNGTEVRLWSTGG